MLPELSRSGGRGLEVTAAPPRGERGLEMTAAPPRGERCAVCRSDDISLPHQANCSHWFCGHCIVGVWLHGSVLQPSDCPLCRRPITLLVPSEVASLMRGEPEIAPVVNRIEQYNGRFAGAPHSMVQWLLDQPFYIRRMLTEFRDTRRGPPLLFKIQVTLAVALSLLYLVCPMDLLPEAVLGYRGLLDDIVVFKIQVALAVALSLLYLMYPMDLLPEAVLGYRGLLDDIVVFIIAYAFVSAAYRAILVARHGA